MSLKVKEIIEELPAIVRVDRYYAITPEELWDWVTKPALTEKWFGTWRRKTETGPAIEIIMNREEGSPTESAIILECNENIGYTLALGGNDGAPPWHILVHVSAEESGGSRFTLIQPWDLEEMRAEVQAGWAYYADCLTAAITATDYPEFSSYLPEK